MDLTGFLFGNVNEEGELEDESVLDKETVSQLSRMGVGEGLGELMEGRGQGRAVGEEGESSEEYDSDADTGVGDKSQTAVDFADIVELAEEGEEEEEEEPMDRALCKEEEEQMFQKGMTFAHSQLSNVATVPTGGVVMAGVSSSWAGQESDDYDMDTEDSQSYSQGHTHSYDKSMLLAGSSDEQSLPNTADSGYDTVSDPQTLSQDMETVVSPSTPTPPTSNSTTLTFLSSDTSKLPLPMAGGTGSAVSPTVTIGDFKKEEEEGEGDQRTAKVGSAIPYLIPENMTIEELHAKVKQLFPQFQPDTILRFSSLLGPPRISIPAKIWAGARRPQQRQPEMPRLLATPPPEMLLDDDEKLFLSGGQTSKHTDSNARSGQSAVYLDPETRAWRFGPAKIWYDCLGLPEDGRGLDYGFKIKGAVDGMSEDEGKPPSLSSADDPLDDDAYLMVTQQPWENDILWDTPYNPGAPVNSIGGVWTSQPDSAHLLSRPAISSDHTSLFPVNNAALLYGRWEEDIIWDSEAVDHIPLPVVPRLDPNDPNIILGIPEEPAPSPSGEKEGKKDGRPKSKFLMNKMGKSSESSSQSSSFLGKKDQFNLSNDEFYNPRHVTSTQGLSGLESTVLQHSLPALSLHQPWFPTHLSLHALRNFHRPRLRLRCDHRRSTTGRIAVEGLKKHIAKKNKEREKERESSGGGEVFFMRSARDLSACDGALVLTEYCEQHPPLLSCTGMATKIKNYYRRPERQVKSHAPKLQFGETTYVQNSSYFLGQLHSGQLLQSFETNLFRAPVYRHRLAPSDLLVVISGSEMFVRDVDTVLLVGQECPKVEVPPPNSKTAMQFQKDFLLLFIYKLFRESDEYPPRIKMEVVRKAFPPAAMSESVIRKVLKSCADFKREGYETGWWVLRSDFRLPSEDEIRAMITPEQVCAYYSTLVAEQRLKDAGYRGKSLFTVEEEEEESSQKIDDEVRAAPWNTTHHFINAMKGKYQLSVSGPADPTGCGEGFSYTRLNTRRDTGGGLPASRRYKQVVGTDGDLRKLKLSKAKQVLRNFGVPEDEISKLSRWAVIDMVRELSTEAAKSGGVDRKSLKFARGARFSQMEAQEKYKEECQRVFELQNKVLSSTEVLSTDEESSSSGGDSDDELAKNLETLLGGKKTTRELSHDQEEAERQELRKLLDKPVRPSSSRGGDNSGDVSGRATPCDADDTSSVKSFSSAVGSGRRLVIMRTFMSESGTEYTRTEVVKSQPVINAYIRLMDNGGKDIRSQFADEDQQTREDMKREKRRIQDQLRRLKRQEEKGKKRTQKPQKQKPLTTINMKCSACGGRGHMKTNKNCPMYRSGSVTVAPTDSDLAQHDASLSQDDLVKVEGTKVVLNRALVEHATGMRRASLLLKFPKDRMRRRRRQGEEDLDYLEKRPKSIQRRKANPEVRLADLLERIISSLITLPESEAFRKPVPSKVVPDYYNVIKFPMDLQTMKENCRSHLYMTREAFWEHVNLIVNNCITYNGFKSELTRSAQKMLEVCSAEMKKHERQLEQLEAEINPALNNDALVAMSYLFTKAIENMKALPDTWMFHEPVPAKKIPDYYKIIRRPMDLGAMRKNCQSRLYHSRKQFVTDVKQIRENSLTYNGPQSILTQTADRMVEVGLKTLDEESELIERLEARLEESISGSTKPIPSGSPSCATPTPSPAPSSPTPSSLLDSSMDYLTSSQAQDLLESTGLEEEEEEVEVERWEGGEEEDREGGEEDRDLLLEDLQHSSSSEDSSEGD